MANRPGGNVFVAPVAEVVRGWVCWEVCPLGFVAKFTGLFVTLLGSFSRHFPAGGSSTGPS